VCERERERERKREERERERERKRADLAPQPTTRPLVAKLRA